MAQSETHLDEILYKALKIESEADRAEYLNEACGSDVDLRARVEKLLGAYPEAGSFLDSPAVLLNATIDQPITEKPGTQIGPYKLLQQIGEGGMGVVYLAEQKQPVKRRVALKIIKPGMDTRQVIARFEAERQALAMMDHPNIAKVLDAGQTDSSRPYFVMELVNGISITKYCDEQHLTPKERLQLFVNVCQAVQHAHQKGIIHRDLKPSNVLVALYDGKAVPKVIDFGVAKATNQTLTDKTMFTQLGQIVGTLEYMSPEQAQRNQLDVDTRSDIYSLGVILYELLSGETPFDSKKLRSAALEEMLRIIREDEPSKPSTKVSSSESLPSIAANRRIDPQKLGATIRGELDWIVMKALEKDRSRRYETASKFAEDVEHYLNDEAVIACPPSKRYRFRKFARRNKVAIWTSAAVAASLIIGIIGTSWQAYRATIAERDAVEFAADASDQADRADQEAKLAREAEAKAINEAQRADQEAAIAKAVQEFMEDDLLGLAGATAQIEADLSPDPNIKLRTIVDRAAEGIEDRFVDQPDVKAAICVVLGSVYYSLGEYQKAENLNREALEIRRQIFGPEHPAVLNIMHDLAVLLGRQDRFKDAETIERQILGIRRRVLGLEHDKTLKSMNNLANSLAGQGQFNEAEQLMQTTLEIQRRVSGQEAPGTVRCMNDLAVVLGRQGKYKEAETLLREALRIQKQVFGPEDNDTLKSMNNLANSLTAQGQFQEAEKLLRETLEIRQRVNGPEHPDTQSVMVNLASALNIQAISLTNQGNNDKAEQLNREALEIRQRVLGSEHPDTLNSMHNLAFNLMNQRQLKEAEKLNRETLAIRQRVLGPEHSDTLKSMLNLAVVLCSQGQFNETEKLSREMLEIQRRVLGWEHPETFGGMKILQVALSSQRKYEELEQLFRETLDALAPEHPHVLILKNNLAASLEKQGRYDEAEELLRKTFDTLERTVGLDDPKTVSVRKGLVGLLTNRAWNLATTSDLTKRDPDEAVRTATLVTELVPDNPNHWSNLGVAQYRAGEFEGAFESLQRADGMIDGGDREHRMFLAMTLWQLGRREDAISRYVEGVAWTSTNKQNSEEQLRFRAEAETVLKIESSESSATVRELPRGETTDRDPQKENSEKTPTN